MALCDSLEAPALHPALAGRFSPKRFDPTAAISPSLLVVNLAHVLVEDSPQWEFSEFSRYDLGQAVAHMTIQGLAMGLDAHQFRAFDLAGIAAEFSVPAHGEVTSMTAFGVAAPGDAGTASPGTSRERMGLEELARVRD